MKAFEKVKYTVLGVLLTVLIFNTATPALAALASKTINVYTGVDIYIDDVKLDPRDANGNPVEPFIYNGTTYLPVRAIGEAFGKVVQWEGSTSSVYVGKHDSEEPAVWLKDLDYFDKDYVSVYNTDMRDFGTQKDNLGNVHTNCIGGGTYSYYYKLNGQYSKITGTLFMLYDKRSVSYTGYVKIYGDGKLLYEAEVSKGVDPIAFAVDLTGVLEMEFRFTGYSNTSSGGISYAAIGDCGLYT